MLEECEVIQRLQVQQDVIQELRNMIEYQVSAKTHYIEENDLYLYHQIVFKEGIIGLKYHLKKKDFGKKSIDNTLVIYRISQSLVKMTFNNKSI